MNSTVIYIKNMVCPRCIDAVKEICNDLHITVKQLQLGKLESNAKIDDALKSKLSKRLEEKGFALLLEKNQKIITQIKSLIVNQIHHTKEPLTINFSDYISKELQHDYAYLSRLFSSIEGITIERFILKQKIEHVKELLFYKEYTLSEIAFQMNYSSVAHLSNQFKKETGLSPTQFKKKNGPNHQSLDSI
ncbi:helix-turn-helix domain-containing protein [Polaribacter sp. Asnod1-A03]|uniref:AraC family transcriptional regulator n=1 Tax=Polaribacter sp. Asnod1-A03 TaxID=3160581 RepID=UPI00386F0AF6